MDKIPNDLYFIILSNLYNAGINVDKDITQLLGTYFKNHELADVFWDLKSENFVKFLYPMQESGHIVFETKTTEPKEGFPKGEILALAKLTPAGYIFYRENRVVYWNIIRSWVAIGIALIAAAFTGWQATMTYMHDKPVTSSQKSNKEQSLKPTIQKDTTKNS
jgi:hypothetical protein